MSVKLPDGALEAAWAGLLLSLVKTDSKCRLKHSALALSSESIVPVSSLITPIPELDNFIIYISVELSNVSFSNEGIFFFYPKSVNCILAPFTELQIFLLELLSLKSCKGSPCI